MGRFIALIGFAVKPLASLAPFGRGDALFGVGDRLGAYAVCAINCIRLVGAFDADACHRSPTKAAMRS